MEPLLILGLLAVGICASIIGTIFGIGGGIFFVPVLTIFLGLSPNEAVAVSLVGIVATSTGAASHFVKTGAANVRLGLLLEITTVVGAMIGAMIAIYIWDWVILCVFAAILIYSGMSMILRKERVIEPPEKCSDMCFRYVDERDGIEKNYEVVNVPGGLAVSGAAGVLSSMTGVGGGTIKVPLMNIYMHVPIKVATATSSYMIGITAFTGAVVYFLQGELLLDHAAAIAIGALLGSLIGTRITKKLDAGPMRKYFSILLFAISVIVLLRAGGVL